MLGFRLPPLKVDSTFAPWGCILLVHTTRGNALALIGMGVAALPFPVGGVSRGKSCFSISPAPQLFQSQILHPALLHLLSPSFAQVDPWAGRPGSPLVMLPPWLFEISVDEHGLAWEAWLFHHSLTMGCSRRSGVRKMRPNQFPGRPMRT